MNARIKSSDYYRARRSAESIIKRYRNSDKFLGCTEAWAKYVRRNSKGGAAIRLAGYLTGTGEFK